MRSLEQLEADRKESLERAVNFQTQGDLLIAKKRKELDDMIAYYSITHTTMIEAANRNYNKASSSLLARQAKKDAEAAAKLLKASQPRLTREQKEIEAAKARQPYLSNRKVELPPDLIDESESEASDSESEVEPSELSPAAREAYEAAEARRIKKEAMIAALRAPKPVPKVIEPEIICPPIAPVQETEEVITSSEPAKAPKPYLLPPSPYYQPTIESVPSLPPILSNTKLKKPVKQASRQ